MPELARKPRGVAVLGATGSVGRQALEVIRASGGRLFVAALGAGRNAEALAAVALEFRPPLVGLADEAAALRLEKLLSSADPRWKPRVVSGRTGIEELARADGADVVLNAVMGSAGLRPTLAALEAGKLLALANKESLVAGGPLVEKKLRGGRVLIPVDSEHSSIFRCIDGGRRGEIKSVIITGSGGPLRDWPTDRIREAKPEDALRHPVWNMGRRITVDSATMMNKALEVIEAQYLLGIPSSDIKVLIHRQAIVHGLVELHDGTLLAHMSEADMRVPIAYALYHPDPAPVLRASPALGAVGRLEFEEPDSERYPCLKLGYRAAAAGGTMPAVLNAADEVAVDAFLDGRIRFGEIGSLVERVMAEHKPADAASVEGIMAADAWARERARALIRA